MSSLVLTATASANLKLLSGESFPVTLVEKSALESTQLVLTVLLPIDPEIVLFSGQRIQLSSKAYGAYASSAFVLTCAYGSPSPPYSVFQAVGIDNQPVQLVAIPAASLVP